MNYGTCGLLLQQYNEEFLKIEKYKSSYIYINVQLFLRIRVFTNGPGDLGSIPGRVIPKTQKWYLMLSCLTLGIIRYVSRVKWSNTGKRIAPSPTPRCSSYRKGSLRVTLDYGRQLYYFHKLVLYLWTGHSTIIFFFSNPSRLTL